MTRQVASTDSSALGLTVSDETRRAGALTLLHPGRGVDENEVRRRVVSDPDRVLVERLRRQDAGAVEALVGAYGDRVYRLAFRITRNAPDAEEVVQDALWTATRKIAMFQGDAAFGSWLYRITANAAYQKLRGAADRAARGVVGGSRPVIRREGVFCLR